MAMIVLPEKVFYRTTRREWIINFVEPRSLNAGYMIKPDAGIIWMNRMASGTSLLAALAEAKAFDDDQPVAARLGEFLS